MRAETAKRSGLKRAARMLVGVTAGMILVLSASCNKPTGNPSGQAPASAKASSPDPQPTQFDACTLFSAADAAHILGMPVRPVTNVGGCSYEGKPSGSQTWMPYVVLNVRKYQAAADETSAWEDLKLLRHLHDGRQNLVVVNGIGTEAYLENIPGKTVETSVIVHKEKSDFQLKEVTDRAPAPEVLKTVAQKVAAGLP